MNKCIILGGGTALIQEVMQLKHYRKIVCIQVFFLKKSLPLAEEILWKCSMMLTLLK